MSDDLDYQRVALELDEAKKKLRSILDLCDELEGSISYTMIDAVRALIESDGG